jgi:hypothetical protein
MLDPTPRRRNFEASATVETLLSTLAWTLSHAQNPERRFDFRHPSEP